MTSLLNTSSIPKMVEPAISPELFTYAFSRMKNWKSHGLDGLHGFWIKYLTSLHDCLRFCFNWLLTSKGTAIDPWLLQGKTTLIMKNKQIGAQSYNYRPITCLPTLWKLLSFIIGELIYSHLEMYNLLPLEQKGCHKKSRGTKNHLLID